jgi:hypothetical protein
MIVLQLQTVWHDKCNIEGMAWDGLHTLRITIHETDDSMAIQLEGRVAGPWVAILGNAWAEAASRLNSRKLSLNLCDVISVDSGGKQALRSIYAQTGASFLANSPWTQFLASEVAGNNPAPTEEKPHNVTSE